MKLAERLFSPKIWQLRLERSIRRQLRLNWPARLPRSVTRRPKIAVITVNFETAHLLARLIFSLRRITGNNVEIGPIVVVDNNSHDGSRTLIANLADAGIVTPIFNQTQKYHGPGLNQGMQLLHKQARANVPGFVDIDYVFVVDSDVFICRGETFSHAINAMTAATASMAGQFQESEYIPGGYAHVSSLLFDPTVTWRRGFHPFEQHGIPALEYQQTIVDRRLIRLDFPFRTNFYLIHLWSGSLKAICSSNDRSNKYFAWASAELPKRSPMDQKTEYVLEEFERVFSDEVPSLQPSNVVEACLRSTPLHLSRPYELGIAPEFVPRHVVSAEGLVAS